ncbi:hypothetical protein TrST_g6311 [Triparma strigata]|uniref:Uncharacterized protein n=1 Tax=Triparma strigata TaxID=1606541 RepID=A0A9W7BYF0_9STRA|nr:hypothetical protein TrST_g6311 [Triparma strigata]
MEAKVFDHFEVPQSPLLRAFQLLKDSLQEDQLRPETQAAKPRESIRDLRQILDLVIFPPPPSPSEPFTVPSDYECELLLTLANVPDEHINSLTPTGLKTCSVLLTLLESKAMGGEGSEGEDGSQFKKKRLTELSPIEPLEPPPIPKTGHDHDSLTTLYGSTRPLPHNLWNRDVKPLTFNSYLPHPDITLGGDGGDSNGEIANNNSSRSSSDQSNTTKARDMMFPMLDFSCPKIADLLTAPNSSVKMTTTLNSITPQLIERHLATPGNRHPSAFDIQLHSHPDLESLYDSLHLIEYTDAPLFYVVEDELKKLYFEDRGWPDVLDTTDRLNLERETARLENLKIMRGKIERTEKVREMFQRKVEMEMTRRKEERKKEKKKEMAMRQDDIKEKQERKKEEKEAEEEEERKEREGAGEEDEELRLEKEKLIDEHRRKIMDIDARRRKAEWKIRQIKSIAKRRKRLTALMEGEEIGEDEEVETRRPYEDVDFNPPPVVDKPAAGLEMKSPEGVRTGYEVKGGVEMEFASPGGTRVSLPPGGLETTQEAVKIGTRVLQSPGGDIREEKEERPSVRVKKGGDGETTEGEWRSGVRIIDEPKGEQVLHKSIRYIPEPKGDGSSRESLGVKTFAEANLQSPETEYKSSIKVGSGGEETQQDKWRSGVRIFDEGGDGRRIFGDYDPDANFGVGGDGGGGGGGGDGEGDDAAPITPKKDPATGKSEQVTQSPVDVTTTEFNWSVYKPRAQSVKQPAYPSELLGLNYYDFRKAVDERVSASEKSREFMEWIEFYYSKEHDEMRKGAREHGNVLFVSYGDFDMDKVSKFFKVISSTKALILKARGMDSRLVSCFVFQALNFFNNVSNHVELNLMKFSELLKYEVEDFAGVGEWEDRIEEYVGLSNSLVTWAPRYSLAFDTLISLTKSICNLIRPNMNDGEIEYLSEKQGRWFKVWERFKEEGFEGREFLLAGL